MQLIKNIYARLGSNILRGGLSIVASILIVQTLGVEVVGRIAYYYALVGMLTLFTDMGIGMAYMKFIATDGHRRQDIACYIFLKLSLIIVFCLIVWVTYQFFYRSPSLDRPMFFIAFIVTVVTLVSQFFLTTLSGRRDFIFLARLELIGSTLLFLYNIAICLLFPSPYLLALNMGILPICFITGGCYYCIRYNIFSFEKPAKDTLVRYFRFAYPIAFSSVIGIFSGHFEKVILGRLIGMKELGFYRLALGIFSGFDKIIKPVTSTLFTEISYRVNKSSDFIQTKFGDLVQTLNMIASLLALLLLFASNPVVLLFYGPENIRTAIILQFFALSIISRLFWRPYRHVLYAIEAHHPLAYLSVIDLILRLGCYYFLIPLTIKGVLIGAIAMPLTEFILWILPSGIYNVIALIKRFETIHISGILYKILLPLGLIIFTASFFNYSLYLLPVFLAFFLALEYYLSVLTKERWDSILLPIWEGLQIAKTKVSSN